MTIGQIVGYARASSTDQSTNIQEQKLTSAGSMKIFSEKVSGSTRDNRDQLEAALDYVRAGDTFVVCKVDRLARSTRDLLNIVTHLDEKGVTFRCLEPAMDTGTKEGKLLLTMLGAVAEFETAIRKERQKEGIEAAKADGRYRGRKPINQAQIAAVEASVAAGVPVARACRDNGISRAVFYNKRNLNNEAAVEAI